jgi:hypothetical protein
MRAFLAAVFMICAFGQTLAASDADQSTIRGIIQDQIEAFQRDDGARAFSYASPTLQSALWPWSRRATNRSTAHAATP